MDPQDSDCVGFPTLEKRFKNSNELLNSMYTPTSQLLNNLPNELLNIKMVTLHGSWSKQWWQVNTYIRHSTLVPWLQKGQLNTVSSLSILFFGGGFAVDFLFPIFPESALYSTFTKQDQTTWSQKTFGTKSCIYSPKWELRSPNF